MSTVALLAFLLGSSVSVSPDTSRAPAVPDTTPPRCEIMTDSDTEPDAGDHDRARVACERARTRFADLFGEPVPGVRVILWEESHYRMGLLGGEAAIFWPTSSAMMPRTDDTIAAEWHVSDQWREVLPHEIAHLLLAVRFFPDGPATPAGSYGTPLPDWLDEAAAIWAEPKESRERRVAQARELPAEYLDLRTILTRPHPATGNSAAYIARDGTARPADYTLWAFYPQAIAVLTFVYDQGGQEATMELVRRLQSDPADPEALAGLPGLPDDFAGVEQAWQGWLLPGEGTP